MVKKKKQVSGRPKDWELVCMRRNPPPGWVDPQVDEEEKKEEQSKAKVAI